MPGQRLRGGQVPAGQARRARLLPEHRHPRGPLRRLAPPLGRVRGDRQRRPPRQPLHLRVGLPCKLAHDQRFRARGLVLRQRLENLRDQPRLGPGQDAVGEQPADTRQPHPQRVRHVREIRR
jgi:hypothetical protein